jgi:hypothetical protein
MCHILDLPPEIVIWVFESLENIDDALHFARSCKYAFSAFDTNSVRLKIFRSIIVRAPRLLRDPASN